MPTDTFRLRPFFVCWRGCLPAIGIFSTACIIALVNFTLLTNRTPEEFAKLKIRVFEKKPRDKKDAEKKNEEKHFGRPAQEIGAIGGLIDQFPERKRFVDVQTRELTFLTTWASINLLQGALGIVVLALTINTIWRYWPYRTKHHLPQGTQEAIIASGCIIVVTFAMLGLLNFFGILDLTLKNSLIGELDDAMRRAVQLQSKVEALTSFGNASVGLVTALTPFSISILLVSRKHRERRFQRCQHLMYWTAFLLVVGVIQVSYQSRWPALFFDDEFNIQQVAQASLSRGLLVGSVFSVASALVFLPAGFVLAPSTAFQNAADAVDPKKNWFTEIFAVLAPVVAALPFGKLFELVQ